MIPGSTGPGVENPGSATVPPAPPLVDRLTAARAFLLERLPSLPATAIILGSGLSGVSTSPGPKVRVPCADVPFFPRITVPGHHGEIIWSEVTGKPLLLLLGRPHYYETGSIDDVLFPVRLLHRLGVSLLFITNAAGGIRDDLRPGSLMAISDQINLTFIPGLGPAHPGRGCIYDPGVLARILNAAGGAGISLPTGVYCGVTGPQYETRAEISMVKKIGGDAVGMSTIHEALIASRLGMKVAGISVIGNTATPACTAVGHADVLSRAEESSSTLGKLVQQFLARD